MFIPGLSSKLALAHLLSRAYAVCTPKFHVYVKNLLVPFRSLYPLQPPTLAHKKRRKNFEKGKGVACAFCKTSKGERNKHSVKRWKCLVNTAFLLVVTLAQCFSSRVLRAHAAVIPSAERSAFENSIPCWVLE